MGAAWLPQIPRLLDVRRSVRSLRRRKLVALVTDRELVSREVYDKRVAELEAALDRESGTADALQDCERQSDEWCKGMSEQSALRHVAEQRVKELHEAVCRVIDMMETNSEAGAPQWLFDVTEPFPASPPPEEPRG